MRFPRCYRLFSVIALSSLSFVAFAQATPQYEVGIGAYYAAGDFGLDSDTKLAYVPVSFAMEAGSWRGQITASKVAARGAGNVLVNIGGLTKAVAADDSAWRGSTGDTLLELSYSLTDGILESIFGANAVGDLSVGARASVKLPTASVEKGLGTGERDTSLQIDSSYFWGRHLLFASLGYSHRGVSPIYADIQSSGFLQLGVARSLNERFSLGAIYDYRQTASHFYNDAKELSAYGSWEIDQHWTMSSLVSVGLNDASSDFGVYWLLNYRW